MGEFFRISSVNFDDSKFAYCEPTNDAKYSSSPKCPKCGNSIGLMYWIEPRKVILSKPLYGDFVCGNKFLVSDKFKNSYEKSDLVGITRFIPVEVVKIRHMRADSPNPPQYYSIDLEYSFARVDLKKSIVKGQRFSKEMYCPLCEPFGTTKDEIHGIHIDDTNWGGEDIFHLHEMGSSIYTSQKFIDFCLEKVFTNLWYINTKNYVRII